jgi:NitT/TauT family transport system substrate-binding protein
MACPDLLRKRGLRAEWTLYGTGPAVVEAFEKGEVDLAYIGMPPAIIGMARGIPLKCIAGGHIEGTVISGDAGFKGYPETKDLGEILNQFCSLKIGVPAKGSIHDVILTDCLDKFNLRNKVAVVNYPWADLITEAVVKKELSGACGTPALAVSIGRYAGGKILYPPSMLWPHNPSYGIVVKTDLLRSEGGELIEKFLMAHEEATSYMKNNTRDAARIIADFVGFIDEKFIFDTLMVSPKYCAQLSEDYISSTLSFVKTLNKFGYISRELSRDDIFDTELIKRIHPDKDHYLTEEGKR